MAVAFILTFPHDHRDVLKEYDRVNAIMHAVAEPPHGLIFHWSAKTSSGDLRVVDVWESQEAFDRFMAEKLGPALAEVTLPAPVVEALEVYNTIEGRVPSKS
ncbi:MAG: hypothetical protein JO199_03045 [Candidatus Eremiobacteraeota bacterium]|nr:hypothetical protein [Candidatus Eremiobacteraeota bacterium]